MSYELTGVSSVAASVSGWTDHYSLTLAATTRSTASKF